jgi:hypothetical protein
MRDAASAQAARRAVNDNPSRAIDDPAFDGLTASSYTFAKLQEPCGAMP